MERMMKLQDVILKAMAGKILWIEAAEIAGMSSEGDSSGDSGVGPVRSAWTFILLRGPRSWWMLVMTLQSFERCFVGRKRMVQKNAKK
jgi:hypothetical protein